MYKAILTPGVSIYNWTIWISDASGTKTYDSLFYQTDFFWLAKRKLAKAEKQVAELNELRGLK